MKTEVLLVISMLSAFALGLGYGFYSKGGSYEKEVITRECPSCDMKTFRVTSEVWE